jgi:hypothetical protein
LPRTLRCTWPPRYHVQHKSSLEISSFILSTVGASSRIRSLTVHQPKKTVNLRPQLHAILRSKPGQFKSTILEAIGAIYKVRPFSEITFPSAIGTVSQGTGKLLLGLVWLNRNNLLLVDEFKTGERGDQAAVDVLLGTMETGYYKRKIGISTPYCFEQDIEDPSLTYRVQDGTFEVQTR